jgi:hypothetical protein
MCEARKAPQAFAVLRSLICCVALLSSCPHITAHLQAKRPRGGGGFSSCTATWGWGGWSKPLKPVLDVLGAREEHPRDTNRRNRHSELLEYERERKTDTASNLTESTSAVTEVESPSPSGSITSVPICCLALVSKNLRGGLQDSAYVFPFSLRITLSTWSHLFPTRMVFTCAWL